MPLARPIPLVASLLVTSLLVTSLLAPAAAWAQAAAPVMPWAREKPAEAKLAEATAGEAKPGEAKAGEAAPVSGFGVAVSVFVTDPAQGYGMYQTRPNNHFKAGETLRFYLEPVGYGFRPVGDLFTFGATVDLRLTQTGNTVYSKDGFLNANFLSHHRNKEINFTGSLDITGAPAGEYKLELVLQDKSSDGVAKVVMPFVID